MAGEGTLVYHLAGHSLGEVAQVVLEGHDELPPVGGHSAQFLL